MKNRLSYISNDQFERCISFARANPEIISVHHILQKLTIFDFVAPIVRQNVANDILEIGCGLGVHSALLSHSGNVQATELKVPGSFVGADDAVEVGRSRVFDELGCGAIGFTYNDGQVLPYLNQSFDIVFHNSVIEHVSDVRAFNREVRRVLRPGGVCICITGAPPLCWMRFILGSVVKFPGNVVLALARETVPTRWLRVLARRILLGVGTKESLIRKAEERVTPVAGRARALFGSNAASCEPDVNPSRLSASYARLRHYFDSPTYNRIVFAELARDLHVSTAQLGPLLTKHFATSLLRRVAFSLTPRTHGQHYRNWNEERREWKVEKWMAHFSETDFAVVDVQPFRFHHVFEAMPLRKWDAYAYYAGSPLIHKLIRHRGVSPSFASEILIVARKPANTPADSR